jgi:hypothetical protein
MIVKMRLYALGVSAALLACLEHSFAVLLPSTGA